MLSRTTRILLVVAALAGIAYLLFGRNRDDRAGDGPERLAPFEIARVDGVVVQRESETLRFVREDSLWRMIEPVADGAERNAVVSLLDALSRAPVARNLGATEDLARFGLDSPIARVTLLAGVDTLLNTAIGKRTVDEAWCYALRGTSNDLLLVPTDIARAATLPVDAYRSRRVVDFGLQQVDSFAFHTGGQTSRWARRGRGWYTVEKGDTVAGDSVAVESVLRRLRGLRIASFLEATHASDSDRYFGIDVWGQGRFLASAMFWCGNTGCQGGTTRPGHSFVVEDDLEDLFALSTTLLRERRLLQFSPPDAARIDVTLPNVEGSLVRRAGAWSYPNPALGRVDPDRAADFVRALRALKWSDLPARGAPRVLAAGRFSITVTSGSGTILDEMRADPRDDGLWYVTSRSTPGVWMIERTELDELAGLFAQIKAR